jgi:hypothetical protein
VGPGKRPQIGSTSRPLRFISFEDRGEKSIAGMNAGNGAQEVAADQSIDILPDQLSGLLQPL